MDSLVPKYTNQTLRISNDLMKISELLPVECGHEPVTLIEGIYCICDSINYGDVDDSSSDQYMKLIDDVAINLKGLPLYYHIQLLHQFTNNYFENILKIQPKRRNLRIVERVTTDMINESKQVLQNTKKCLSPFELLYLYADSIIDNKITASPHQYDDFMEIKDHIATQRDLILTFLDKYEKLYGDALKKEAQKYAKA